MKWILFVISVVAPAVVHAADPELTRQIESEVRGERYGSAVVLCEQALKDGDPTLELRGWCGKAYVGLGDKLLAAGSPENARQRWSEAVSIDPRLIDDPAFTKRLEGKPEAKPDPEPKPDPKPESTPEVDPNKKPEPMATPRRPRPAEVRPKPLPRKPMPVIDEDHPPANAGPRWGRGFGLGLSFGFDGLASLSMGWLADETILAEVSLGIVYPSADVRVRWLGLRECVTPFIGIGVLVPFGETDRFGFNVASYQSLYELGEAFHFDIGLAYTPVYGLDLYAGLALVTPFDQDHPDTVFFFPQFTGGASWYF